MFTYEYIDAFLKKIKQYIFTMKFKFMIQFSKNTRSWICKLYELWCKWFYKNQ